MGHKPIIGDLVAIVDRTSMWHNRLGIVVATSGLYCQIKWCNPDALTADGRRSLYRKEYTEVRNNALRVF